MKITSVELHPDNSTQSAILSFQDPRKLNSYNIKAITGLDADELFAKYYGISDLANSKFYTLSLERRDIIFSIELNPKFTENESYSELRDSLYKMIASSRTGLIEIQFKNGTEIVAVMSGFVSKFEANLFTKTPEVKMTIKPNDPMLKAPARVEVEIEGVIPSLIEVTDVLSTAPHGFIFTATFTDTSPSLLLKHPSEDLDNTQIWSFEVTPVTGFFIDDVLSFSSEVNNKFLTLLRDDEVYNLANIITPGSYWPIIFPGENEFLVDPENNLLITNLKYFPTYWGI